MQAASRSPLLARTPTPISASGRVTLPIGRRRSEASPVMKRGEGMAGQQAEEQPRAGARISEIEHAVRLGEAADADALHVPEAVSALLDIDAKIDQSLCWSP